MWHVSQNDRQQRELVLSALANLPTTLDIKGGIKRLQWAQKQTDELANYRNVIVHAPMQFSHPFAEIFGDHIPPPIPKIGSVSTKPVHTRRLRLIKSVRFWKMLRNDLLNLKDYVGFTTRQIAWREYERQKDAPVLGVLRAWPRRPRLPSIRKIKMIEQSLKHLNRAPIKRRKRPRPSGGKLPI